MGLAKPMGKPDEPVLSGEEIKKLLPTVPGWSLKGKALEREFVLENFVQAMKFVNGVADAANRLDHHPDIFIYYNKVRLSITTHKAGGLTEEDFGLARELNRLTT